MKVNLTPERSEDRYSALDNDRIFTYECYMLQIDNRMAGALNINLAYVISVRKRDPELYRMLRQEWKSTEDYADFARMNSMGTDPEAPADIAENQGLQTPQKAGIIGWLQALYRRFQEASEHGT